MCPFPALNQLQHYSKSYVIYSAKEVVVISVLPSVCLWAGYYRIWRRIS